MIFRRKRKYRQRTSFLGRVFRSFFSIIILSALVLGISYFVKEVSTMDGSKFARYTNPVFSRLGISEEEVGDVAGKFIKRVSETDLNISDSSSDEEMAEDVEDGEVDSDKGSPVLAALMADCEGDMQNFEKALNMAKEKEVDVVFFLGDFTSVGDEVSLKKAKAVLDESGFDYYTIPGDHDLAQSVDEGDLSGLKLYTSVFGKNFHIVRLSGMKIVMLDNSANYTPVSSDLMFWFKKEVVDADFVLLSQPLYHPSHKDFPGLYPIMGFVDDVEVGIVRKQAKTLLELIRESDAKAVIAADQHRYSQNVDSTRDSLEHVVVGALVSNLRNPQSPRFAILSLFNDGDYALEEVIL